MVQQSPRLVRGHKTISAMMRIYCDDHHGEREELCPECQELLDYAGRRLDGCPFGEDKPTCSQCTVHCYKPDMRQRIAEVMRYAGPRMIHRHPVLAIGHLLDGKNKRR